MAIRLRCCAAFIVLLAFAPTAWLHAQEPELTIQVDVSASAPDNETWLELQSANFRIVGNADEDDLRKIAADLELFRDVFAQIFPRVRKPSAAPVTVVVFRNDNAYLPFRPIDDGGVRDAPGYVQPDRDVHYIVLTGRASREVYRDYVRILLPEGAAPAPLWFQEGIADYMSTIKISGYPLGSARNFDLGNPPAEYDRLLRDRSFRFMPLTALFDVGIESPEYLDPEQRQAFLAQSFALVHFILESGSSQSSTRGIGPMLRLFGEMLEGQTIQSAFSNSHQEDLATFENDFVDHINGMRTGWNSLAVGLSLDRNREAGLMLTVLPFAGPSLSSAFDVNMFSGQNIGGRYIASPHPCDSLEFKVWLSTIDWTAFDPTSLGPYAEGFDGITELCWIEVDQIPLGFISIPFSYDQTLADIRELPFRSLSEGERHFYRGDVMLRLGRFDAARDYFERAIERAPALGRAHASLGRLQALQGDYAAAHESFLRATMLEPGYAPVYYYRALAIRDEVMAEFEQGLTDGDSESLEAMRVLLMKSLELAPHLFIEAAELLAQVNLLRGAELEESFLLMLTALRHSPGRHSLTMIMAEIAAVRGDAGTAEWLANRILRSGTAGAEIQQAAASLLEALPAPR